jgi:putative two-component system response regulator
MLVHPTAVTADQNYKEPREGHSAEVTRILVADANSTVRKILGHVFAGLGWKMIEARDGDEAIAIARQRPAPHAILLDLKLPGKDGYEVCRILKQDLECQLIPIVALTSVETADEKMKAVHAGVDEFLSKPVNHAELQVRLRSLTRTHRFNQELIGAESVAMALARAVASKDGYSNSHVEHVANLAEDLARAIGMSHTEQKIVRYGAILHNVGKIAIPDAVLEKTTSLTPREKALFQQHPRVGCDICSPLKPLKPVLPIIRHHKEHWDGTGYPDGLREDEIPLGAQVVGVVDVYSALISDRPFRKAISQEEACMELRRRAKSGCHNPALVEKFIANIEMTCKEKAIVTGSTPHALPLPATV